MARVKDLNEMDSIQITETVNTEIPVKVKPRTEFHRSYDALPDTIMQLLRNKTGTPLMLALTSCHSHEGVSTVAANLAQFLARRSKEQVLLVDLNLNDPGVHRLFGKRLSPGLVDLMVNTPLELSCIQYTAVENLNILTAGESFDGYEGLYDMDTLSELIDLMKRDYEYVIFDTPSLCEDNAIIRLAGLVDGIVLVVESERVRWEVAQRAKERLQQAQGNILGVILNKRKFHVPDWAYDRM